MSWMLILAIAAAMLVIALLIYATSQADTFCYERSAVIPAGAEAVFPMINDIRRMNAWNPFVKPDPDIKIAYWGPADGVGAGHSWDGNRQVGKGTIEIIESQPNTSVVMRLRTEKPMKADHRVTFLLEPVTEGTRVTWRLQGQQPFIGKLVSLVIDCDAMCGSQFEKGLASMKALAEPGR